MKNLTFAINQSSFSKIDKVLGIFAILIIITAWIIGSNLNEGNQLPFILDTISEAEQFKNLREKTYAAYLKPSDADPIGYVKLETSGGYGGPLTVAVGIDIQGRVIGINIVDHKETPPFFNRVLKSDFINSLVGKTYKDQFIPGEDLDSISGATQSIRALAEAVRRGSVDMARKELNLNIPPEEEIPIRFEGLEIFLVALFSLGLISRRQRKKFKKRARWISMLLGLLVLGFIYNTPLTISMVSQLLLGFWPHWKTSLFWFFLLGGVGLFLIMEKTNPYCDWFCPFGATQECVGQIGKAKIRSTGPFDPYLKWFQRMLALAVIVIALLFRNPGLTSYEVFGTLFEFIGSNFQFMLLGIVLVMALFIRRPWCNYLCPLRPVVDFLRMLRSWISELWQRRRSPKAV